MADLVQLSFAIIILGVGYQIEKCSFNEIKPSTELRIWNGQNEKKKIEYLGHISLSFL